MVVARRKTKADIALILAIPGSTLGVERVTRRVWAPCVSGCGPGFCKAQAQSDMVFSVGLAVEELRILLESPAISTGTAPCKAGRQSTAPVRLSES